MLIKRQKNNNNTFRSLDKKILNIKTLNDLDMMSQVPYNRLKSIKKAQIQGQYKHAIDEQINNFFKHVVEIINKNQLNIADAFNYVRQAVVFKEIDQIQQQSLSPNNRGKLMENSSDTYGLTQHHISQKYEVKQETDRKDQEEFGQSGLKLNMSGFQEKKQIKLKNSVQNIYNKAKASSFEEFEKFFRELHKNNKFQFFNIKAHNRPTRARLGKEGYLNAKAKIITEIVTFFSYKFTPIEIKQLEAFLQKQLNFQCKNPCCKWSSQDQITHQTSAFTISSKAQSKIKVNYLQTIYKSDKVQQYYNRYYNNSFRIQNIKNLEKTNGEQIDKLYKQYMIKQKYANKIKIKNHFKSQIAK